MNVVKNGKFTFLSRIRRDQTGNMLAMGAAAILPLMGMIGAGVDISRGYVVKSRLQIACDSGALAGRRTLTGGEWGEASEEAARTFFATNFVAGSYGSKNLAYDYDADDALVVKGTASADVPTSVMQIFGKTQISVSVTCDAEMQIPNSDIMFVLDTTGSMADTNPSDTVSRIAALRAAVKNFHQTLESAKTSASQVRYGFVPYATSVNVGFLLKREWMVDRWTYQSRIPDGTELVTSTSTSNSKTTNTPWVRESGNSTSHVSYLSLESCVAPPNTSANKDVTSRTETTNEEGQRVVIVERTRTTTGSSYAVAIVNGACRLTETRYNNLVQTRTETTTYVSSTSTSTSTRYWWMYRPVEFDVSGLKGSNANGLMAGGTLTAQIANNHGNRTITWNGCIEERDTVRQDTYDTIPVEAIDLDVDRIPDAALPSTQWRPALGQLVYARNSITNWSAANVRSASNFTNIGDHMSAFYAACPSRSRKLGTINTADINTYLNGLTVNGNTYHDIGFLWGLRLLSPTGLFAAENSAAANGGSISRHLIFMTDGETDTDIINYDAYGLSALDRRRTSSGATPTNAAQNTIVERRLAALCTEAKNRNITVWVIAFGTELTELLEDCASTGRAFEADNSAELNDTFSKIAAQISQLRITR